MIAALVPTIYRPVGLERVILSLRMTAPNVDIIVAGEFDDLAGQDIAEKYLAEWVDCKEVKAGPAYAWNTALRAAPDYDIYVLAADDLEFKEGWLENALQVLSSKLNGSGLVGFNDETGKFERAGFATHYMMTRDFIIEHNGGVMVCPYYLCDFVDLEANARAKRAGKFAYSPNSHVPHYWRVVDDEGYRRADKRRSKAKEVFITRKALGFPDDFERILT